MPVLHTQRSLVQKFAQDWSEIVSMTTNLNSSMSIWRVRGSRDTSTFFSSFKVSCASLPKRCSAHPSRLSENNILDKSRWVSNSVSTRPFSTFQRSFWKRLKAATSAKEFKRSLKLAPSVYVEQARWLGTSTATLLRSVTALRICSHMFSQNDVSNKTMDLSGRFDLPLWVYFNGTY